MAQPVRFNAVVEKVSRYTADVASYRLRSEKRLPRFTPGQFIHLTIDEYDPSNFWPESRVFSVANAVADRHTIELTISRQGEYTSRILDSVKEGSTVWAKGPYGEFNIGGNANYKHIVLIAGGTGVTPFGAFMDAVLVQGTLPVERVTLYYGALTPELLIYKPLSDRCAIEALGFTAIYFAEQHSKDDPSIQEGRLDLEDILNSVKDVADTAFYISGPKSMIGIFKNQLTGEYGLTDEQVIIDAWE